MGRQRSILAALVGLTALAVAAANTPAQAGGPAELNVNSFNDKEDADIGDNVCAAANGKCTLRAAVMESNASLGTQTINVPEGTYELTTFGLPQFGDLDVTAATVIAGEGANKTIIRQTVPERVFDVNVPGDVATNMRDLTITGGQANAGGGIHSNSTLFLNKVTLKKNRSTGAGSSTGGGGIRSTSFLSISRSLVTKNESNAETMGSSPTGAGIEQRSGPGDQLFIMRTTISKNKSKALGVANDGTAGGLLNQGPGTIERSTISGNKAVRGAGIFTTGTDELGIFQSTISGNKASAVGAAWTAHGPISATNSTISGNETGADGFGPAIDRNDGVTEIVYSTIADNRNLAGGASAIDGGPVDGDGVSLKGTIIDNPGDDCTAIGQIASFGYNVDTSTTCDLGAAGDQEGANPRLGPLADNGGLTFTHKLLAGSVAIDAGDPGCPSPSEDQTGDDRPNGASCDAGSYEKG